MTERRVPPVELSVKEAALESDEGMVQTEAEAVQETAILPAGM